MPNYDSFLAVVRCIRLWAKRRGLYSNKMGFFGGINCNLLVCFVCQLYPQVVRVRVRARARVRVKVRVRDRALVTLTLTMQALLLVQLLTLPGGDGQGDGQQPKTKAA